MLHHSHISHLGIITDQKTKVKGVKCWEGCEDVISIILVGSFWSNILEIPLRENCNNLYLVQAGKSGPRPGLSLSQLTRTLAMNEPDSLMREHEGER